MLFDSSVLDPIEESYHGDANEATKAMTDILFENNLANVLLS